MAAVLSSLTSTLLFSFRSRLALQAEILAFCHQIVVLKHSSEKRLQLLLRCRHSTLGNNLSSRIQEAVIAFPVSQVYANEPTILAHCRHRCLAHTCALTQ